MLCFWRYKVLLYPYTTQLLNYTISLHMKYYFFMMYCIFALVLGLHFCVKIFKFMPDFFFFFHISHSFQCGVILTLKTRSVNTFFLYIPSEQPNQAQFLCVCINNNVWKVTKSYSTEMKGTFFLLSKSRLTRLRVNTCAIILIKGEDVNFPRPDITHHNASCSCDVFKRF